MRATDRDFEGDASGDHAVKELGEVLREREKTKRMLIGAAVLLFIVAAVVLVFAPSDRQIVSAVLGVALIIFALGAVGAAVFSIKLPGVTVSSGSNQGARTSHQKSRSQEAA